MSGEALKENESDFVVFAIAEPTITALGKAGGEFKSCLFLFRNSGLLSRAGRQKQ